VTTLPEGAAGGVRGKGAQASAAVLRAYLGDSGLYRSTWCRRVRWTQVRRWPHVCSANGSEGPSRLPEPEWERSGGEYEDRGTRLKAAMAEVWGSADCGGSVQGEGARQQILLARERYLDSIL